MTNNLSRVPLSVAGLFLVLLLPIAYAAQSLNTYKGDVKDLLPQRVNKYRKGKKISAVPLGISRAGKELKRLGDEGAAYSLNNKRLDFTVITFDSPANAAKALKIMRLSGSESITVKNWGVKKKGRATVGERFELEWLYPQRKGEPPLVIKQIYWTNGSVLFTITGDGSGGTDIADLKAFEDALAY